MVGLSDALRAQELQEARPREGLTAFPCWVLQQPGQAVLRQLAEMDLMDSKAIGRTSRPK